MAVESHVLELVVAEVLRRLRGLPSSRPAVREPRPVPSQTAGGAQLKIDNRVVAMSVLDGRLEGISHLLVPSGAVVTPLVRDELRHRGVSLQCITASSTSAKSELAVAVADADAETQRVVEAMVQPGGCVDSIVRGGLTRAVAEVVGRVRGSGCRALIATRRAHAAVCLANRTPGIRAVAARDAKGAREAIQAVAANVLVVDSASICDAALSDMITMFARCDVSSCPVELREPA